MINENSDLKKRLHDMIQEKRVLKARIVKLTEQAANSSMRLNNSRVEVDPKAKSADAESALRLKMGKMREYIK
jgi:hypothetical protein